MFRLLKRLGLAERFINGFAFGLVIFSLLWLAIMWGHKEKEAKRLWVDQNCYCTPGGLACR